MDFKIRDRSVVQGRRPLSEERRLCLLLMQRGVSNKEACRTVGINEKTGRRWRNGRAPSGGHVGASPTPKTATTHRFVQHLSADVAVNYCRQTFRRARRNQTRRALRVSTGLTIPCPPRKAPRGSRGITRRVCAPWHLGRVG
ncbi:helix-turn-helix domain-containing protein [Streptomyces sp. NPDC006660]|uniref:helix-turn-helix domain-containing protein n=1 Tax=Streptomyces sp. NPDC006660 TaxID=3156901 RepID=UPI0033C99882